MEISNKDFNELFNIYLDDSSIVYNCSNDCHIKIIKSTFKPGLNTYVIENHHGILNKLYFNYSVKNNISERSYVLNIKILDIYGYPIDTPYNLYINDSYIDIGDLENYLRWYAALDNMHLLNHSTLDNISNA